LADAQKEKERVIEKSVKEKEQVRITCVLMWRSYRAQTCAHVCAS
jgi:hypothetical protein